MSITKVAVFSMAFAAFLSFSDALDSKTEKDGAVNHSATIFLKRFFKLVVQRKHEFDAPSNVWINSSEIESFPTNARCPTVIGFTKYSEIDEGLSKADSSLRIKFSMNKNSRIETVYGAELKFFKESGRSAPRDSYTVSIYLLPSTENESVLLHKKEVTGSKTTWLTFNVKDAVEKWQATPESNNGFEVIVANSIGQKVDAKKFGLVDIHGPENERPFMLAFVKESKISETLMPPLRSFKQKIRSSSHKRTEDVAGQCRLTNLTINLVNTFEDFFIAARELNIYKCIGRCTIADSLLNFHEHAWLQINQPDNEQQPCCAPSKYADTSVLYFDNHGEVQLDTLSLIVRECVCQ